MNVEPLHFARMQSSDLDEVASLEASVFPENSAWSRQSFENSLADGYDAWVLRNTAGLLIGYSVCMKVLDETQLLTIAVDKMQQGKGYGKQLMGDLIARAKRLGAVSLFLEVRPSNLSARHVYQKMGFEQVGLRKQYYRTDTAEREDALVLRLSL